MQVVLSLQGVARAIIAEVSVETEIEEVGTVVEANVVGQYQGFARILFAVDVSAGVGIACEGHSKDGKLIVFQWQVDDGTKIGIKISVHILVSRRAFAGTLFGGCLIDNIVDDIVPVGHQ